MSLDSRFWLLVLPPIALVAKVHADVIGQLVVSSRQEGLRQTGATSFEINHDVVDRLFEDQGKLLMATRAAAVFEQGRVVGVRLARVGPALTSIGLADGDRLDAVNGVPIGDSKRMLEAYAVSAE